MGYMLPLNFVKISVGRSDNRQFDVAICATRIVAIMSTEIHQARKTIAQEKKNGTLINAAGTNKARSAVFLDNGSVIASPLTVRRIMTLIRKANEWGSGKESQEVKAYEGEEEDFDEEEEDDI